MFPKVISRLRGSRIPQRSGSVIDQEFAAVQQCPEQIFQAFARVGGSTDDLMALDEFIGGR